jgi:hypothetical protein
VRRWQNKGYRLLPNSFIPITHKFIHKNWENGFKHLVFWIKLLITEVMFISTFNQIPSMQICRFLLWKKLFLAAIKIYLPHNGIVILKTNASNGAPPIPELLNQWNEIYVIVKTQIDFCGSYLVMANIFIQNFAK